MAIWFRRGYRLLLASIVFIAFMTMFPLILITIFGVEISLFMRKFHAMQIAESSRAIERCLDELELEYKNDAFRFKNAFADFWQIAKDSYVWIANGEE